MDNFHEDLPGGYARQHLFTQGFFLNLLKKIFGDLVVHICFEERYAHLTQRITDVLFSELSVALDFLEYDVESFLELLKHNLIK